MLFITCTIYCAFDDTPSKDTGAVFLALSTAFDIVWHTGLICKVRCNGVSGNMLALIAQLHDESETKGGFEREDFRADRCSCRSTSRICAAFSTFFIYTNNLCDNLNSNFRLFTDDISLLSVVGSEIAGTEELNRNLEKV